MAITRLVGSTGLAIRVTEHSPGGLGRPTVVLVHGYPDRQQMWDPVVAALPLDRLHVVTYDVRGAGGSGVPSSTRGYRSELLLDDLVAVLDAVLPDGGAAHLVGHDWGSIQLWDAVAAERSDDRLRGRVASFTSVSGPSLDHTAWLARHGAGRRAALLRQLAHSWYVYLFQVPHLPELVWRRAGSWLRRAAVRLEGTDHWGEEMAQDAARGVNLYRANVPRRLARPRELRVHVPVLVVHPLRDRFLTGVLTQDLDRSCSDVRVVEVDAGHWFPRTHPRDFADLVVDHVLSHA
jgi:pimeloyl-ACP methyl ester carboxylesterase